MKRLGILLFAAALTSLNCHADPGSKSRERAFHNLMNHVGKIIKKGDRSQFLGFYSAFRPDDSQRVEYDLNLVFAASYAADTFFIDFLVASGVDINCHGNNGQNCIVFTVERFDDEDAFEGLERIKHLAEIGLNVTHVDNDGQALCHYAAEKNRATLITLLKLDPECQGFLDLDGQNKRGQTPLMICAQYGLLEAGTALLQAGASTSIRDTEGRTALDYASIPPDPDSVSDAGISPESKKKLQELLSKPIPAVEGAGDTTTGGKSGKAPQFSTPAAPVDAKPKTVKP